MNLYAWIYAARPKTLVASIVPILCATFILPKQTVFKLHVFIFTLMAATIIQITTNYINDLYDFLKGADEARIGPTRMIQSGALSKPEILLAIKLLIIIGVLCGIPLVMVGGWPIVIIGLSSFLFAYLYTAGPFPLAYNGLGDVFVFIYFGIIAVLGSYYLQVGFIDKGAIFLGISLGAKNVILLTINNIRDYDTDKKVNKKTLIVLFGQWFGIFQIVFMLIISYFFLYLLSLQLENLNIFYILVLSLPLALNILYDICNKNKIVLNKTLAKVSLLLVLECILIAIGMNI